ncbi:oxygen-dependent protoporphyrinogen oxidase [Prauserella aidingensis]|uniref:protoporphyrinogen oxidase n=1 Tax=Prauserella aidingensis TaxID=387890 RepID=UPI0020A2915E|nr:protoporphyrinogen oxidase [Prauserella aidingensis]MCP2254632.1 oxygen-dependent protoporphyrinogen oxidase [Prauserella aidingensis]
MKVAVVGGGVSGLTAAYRLRTLLGPDAAITVCEASGDLGGKLRTVEVGGEACDVGAEAFLARRPEALDLVHELGLTDRLRHPSGASSSLRAGGVTVGLPKRTVMGVPAAGDAVAHVLSDAGVRAVEAERNLAPVEPVGADVSLGGLLRSRLGDEVVDRLVDPLLGGVYAGGADGLGLRAVLPALAHALDGGAESITSAIAAQLPDPAAPPNPAPVFGTLAGGLASLTTALAARAEADVRLGVPVRALTRRDGGWRLTFGAVPAAHAPAAPDLDVDAVVLAVPAPAAARLLADVAPSAAAAYGEVELASVAVVALALPPGTALPDSSGVLIGAGERTRDGGRFTAKAFTFSARKWPHQSDQDGPVLLRGSVGRFGDLSALRATDDELVRRVRADLAELTGITAEPVEARVQRWGGGLPQYGVGHGDRVARIEEAVSALPGLAVAGAALHGVGIPACIGTADAAARRVAARVAVGS